MADQKLDEKKHHAGNAASVSGTSAVAVAIANEKKKEMGIMVRKRTGALVPFDLAFIERAVGKALAHTKEPAPAGIGAKIAQNVAAQLLLDWSPTEQTTGASAKRQHACADGLCGELKGDKGLSIPQKCANGVCAESKCGKEVSIERIQNLVEDELMDEKLHETARAYIRYRHEHEQKRAGRGGINYQLDFNGPFRGNVSQFATFLRTYARTLHSKGRRESFAEVKARYMKFMRDKLDKLLTEKEYTMIGDAIYNLEALPSMRLLQFAGRAADRENLTAFNCSALPIEGLNDFRDAMYLLMCGVGVGYSVEKKYVSKLPFVLPVRDDEDKKELVQQHVVEDTKEGWVAAFHFGLKNWFRSRKVVWDYSKIRPAGAPLMVMGGHASGPEPLKKLFAFCEQIISAKPGQQLSTLEVHRILCFLGQCVRVGSTRRSALICISDLDDVELRNCKHGDWWLTMPELSLANISTAYNRKPSKQEFAEEWKALEMSGSGERGVFNREAIRKTMPLRRYKDIGPNIYDMLTNPCSEILLKPRQLCNLSTVVCRENDDLESLKRKIRIAAILGTYQSMLTDFHVVSPEFKKNCEEERLLGVSMTGQMDCRLFTESTPAQIAAILEELRDEAVRVNVEYAKRFGIPASKSVTCVKPEGTTSCMVDSASGMHARFAPYYIRRVRIGAADPLRRFLAQHSTINIVPENGQENRKPEDVDTWVMEFYNKSPDSSITEDEQNSLDRLKRWKLLKQHYVEHSVSATVFIDQKEWDNTRDWVYENWDIASGIAFLPRFESTYKLMPFERITKEQYDAHMRTQKPINWNKFVGFDQGHIQDLKSEAACVGGNCMPE